MKKKVGILSMQRIKNYGSFLQAYGLKSILEELGADVQFVDYHPGKTLIPADGGNRKLFRKIDKGFNALKGSAPLIEKIRYINYKKKFSQSYYPYLGITNQMIYSPDVDLLVVGSDEVFNCVQNNSNVGFTPDLFGQNSFAKKKISYAASFGNTDLQKLQKYKVDEKVGNWLKSFDALSVRDLNSYNVVKGLTGIEAEINLDPVLMYNFYGTEKIPDIKEKNYMLLYGYNNRFTKSECRMIRSYAKKKKLKIYCIGGVQSCCDRFIDTDPFTVIGYFKNANCIVTDTFHGTIMSIITHRQFVSLIRNTGYGNSEKLGDLLRRLKIKDRGINDLENIEILMDNKINYESVKEIIIRERIKTRKYLKKWL